jgi:hypothetical protein
LRGNHENTDIGGRICCLSTVWALADLVLEFLADYLELNLRKVTEILLEKGVSRTSAGTPEFPWMGRSLEELKVNATDAGHFNVDAIDCYHGDFRRHKH